MLGAGGGCRATASSHVGTFVPGSGRGLFRTQSPTHAQTHLRLRRAIPAGERAACRLQRAACVHWASSGSPGEGGVLIATRRRLAESWPARRRLGQGWASLIRLASLATVNPHLQYYCYSLLTASARAAPSPLASPFLPPSPSPSPSSSPPQPSPPSPSPPRPPRTPPAPRPRNARIARPSDHGPAACPPARAHGRPRLGGFQRLDRYMTGPPFGHAAILPVDPSANPPPRQTSASASSKRRANTAPACARRAPPTSCPPPAPRPPTPPPLPLPLLLPPPSPRTALAQRLPWAPENAPTTSPSKGTR